jgi:sulfatase modifying factor 1
VDASGYVTEAERPGQGGCHGPGKAGAWVAKASTHWRAPGHAQTDSHPVVCVSFADVQAYLQWINGSSERYRLASEAEWEFAARGGTTSPRPWSDAGGFFARAWGAVKPGSKEPASRACKYANVADESAHKQLELPATVNCDDGYPAAVPGGYYSRNNFGLYDMIGNVAEWTQDCWNPNHAGAAQDARPRTTGDCSRRVVRGGSWASAPHTVRSAARQGLPLNYRSADLGFRIARSARE